MERADAFLIIAVMFSNMHLKVLPSYDFIFDNVCVFIYIVGGPSILISYSVMWCADYFL